MSWLSVLKELADVGMTESQVLDGVEGRTFSVDPLFLVRRGWDSYIVSWFLKATFSCVLNCSSEDTTTK